MLRNAQKIQVFAAMFQANMRERNEGRVSIDDISSTILKKMLAFMYTGEVPDLSNADDAIGLLEAAAKYEIDVLKVLSF
jgi:predicted amino acid-binding ACT domain protein